MFLIIILCLIILIAFWHKYTRKPANFPPGPKWYPIIGSSYILQKAIRKYGSLYQAYEEWSKEYNSSVIGLKLGNEFAIVALDYPTVVTIHNSEVFDGRPDNFFMRLRSMGKRQGITGVDGPLWAEHKAFTLRHLKEAGYGRQQMRIAVKDELIDLLEIIQKNNGLPIEPGSIIAPAVMNILWTFTAGRKFGRNNESLKTLLFLLKQRLKAFDFSGGILNSMPWIRYIAPVKSGYSLIQEFNVKIHKFLTGVIDEHKIDYSDEKTSQDLIYAYLKEIKDRSKGTASSFTDDQLTFIMLDIFIGGSDSTSITLNLALMSMVLFPHIQKHVQIELDENLSFNELPNLNDQKKFPYTQAVILEVQRFYHIVPISGPRRTLSKTTLGGYMIPKGSTVFIGLQSLLMDPEYWQDPEIFRPERFLTKDMEIIKHDRFVPFGQGRRRCLGETLARGCLFVFFAGIMRKFSISHSNTEKPLDRKLVPGIFLTPKPHKLVFTQRST